MVKKKKNALMPRLSVNSVQIMGWKPTWWDFWQQYKVAAPKGSPRLWILVLFVFIMFIYVCLCLIVSVGKNWLLEIELFGAHSKDVLERPLCCKYLRQNPFKMGKVNSIPPCSPLGCVLQNWVTFSYDSWEKEKDGILGGNTMWWYFGW